eukprot:Skav208159  [mRNA]  locus=scaffold2891:158598:163679:+ [translate_table: standard]
MGGLYRGVAAMFAMGFLPCFSNPFQVLGVGPDATEQQVREGFRRMAKVTHPDVATGDAERFREVLWAAKEGFLGEVAEYVESADNDVLLARVVTVSALYNVQCAEMDRENAIRDFSDAAEVSTLLLLLRAYAAKKLASLGNFDFYGHGFNAIAKALPKLEETWLEKKRTCCSRL